MNAKKSVVSIPVETKVREFDGKLWLALNLVERGNTAVIGSTEMLNVLDIVKPDIHITKDIGDSGIDFYSRLRDAGISICGLNTEGGVFQSLEKFTHNKTEFLNYIDSYCTWGQKQANLIQQKYENDEGVFVTGNPRFDLLHPKLRFLYENRSSSINDEYGEYMLVNGNFSLSNAYAKNVIEKTEEIYGEIDMERRSYAHRIFYLFLESIYHLHSEFPETNIVVRPHPSERIDTYNEAFAGWERVHIEDTRDVRDWVAGASVVIHHDCTTGIESAMMGTPVVSYRPIQNEEYESRLPQIVSHEARSRKALTEYVASCLESDEPYDMADDQTRKLKQYFHNVDQSAAALICDVIESIDKTEQRNYERLQPGLSGSLKRRVKSSRLGDQATTIYDSVHRALGNESIPEQREYHKQKFPELKRTEIRNTIEQMKPLLDIDTVTIERVALTNDTYYLRSQ